MKMGGSWFGVGKLGFNAFRRHQRQKENDERREKRDEERAQRQAEKDARRAARHGGTPPPTAPVPGAPVTPPAATGESPDPNLAS